MSRKFKILLFALLPIILLGITTLTFYFLSKSSEEQGQKEENAPEQYYEPNKITFKTEGEVEAENDGKENIENKESQTKKDEEGKISDIKIDQAQMVEDWIYFYSQEVNTYGRINISNKENQIEILLNDLPVLSETQLSPSQDKLLYKDYTQDSYFIYDFNNKSTKALNKDIKTALWHPQEANKIIGAYSSSNINNINVYNIENDNREELINLFISNGVILDISQDGSNLLYTRVEPGILYKEFHYIELDSELGTIADNFLILFDNQNKQNIWQREDIDQGKFSPNSKSLLVSKPSLGPYPVLSILNIEASTELNLNLGTYLDKAEFIDQSNLAYAKVEELRGEFFQTTLWKYNIDNNRHTQLTRSQEDITIDIANIMSSSDGQRIYFINRFDKNLYLVNTE